MNDPQIRNDPMEEMWTFLCSDIPPWKKLPLIAHYTSINVIEKILRENKLWFSNPLFMNDYEEVSLVINKGFELIENSLEIREACGTPERADIFYEAFRSYFLEFTSNHIFDTYVLCFSEHDSSNDDGKLSMWRGYGDNGNGAAIVLGVQELPHVVGSPLIFDKIHYFSNNVREKKLKDRITEIAGKIKTLSTSDDRLKRTAYQIFERIKLYALFTKHDGFEEEKEWRVVYLRERDDDNLISPMCDYHIGPNGIEPKLKLEIKAVQGAIHEDINLNTLIQKIILGPGHSDPLKLNAVKTMLDRCGKPALKEKVVASTIPFRAK